MALFVITATHSSDQCPLSNSKVRNIFPGTDQRAAAAKKFGVKILVGPIFSINHKSIVVCEASSIDSVMNVLMEIRIPQWNSVDVQPYMTAESVSEAFEKTPPIY